MGGGRRSAGLGAGQGGTVKKRIPHLFAKLVVLWCVSCGTAACAYALRILSRTGYDPAALLGVILAFFGGELLMVCLKTILKNGKDGEHEQN